MKRNGKWQILRSSVVYTDPWGFTLHKDEVLDPKGKRSTYSYLSSPHGSHTIPVDAYGNLYLLEEFRYAARRRELAVAGGVIEPRETPLAAAKRELLEEMGMRAKRWSKLGVFSQGSNKIDCPTNLFVAQELSFALHAREGAEDMRVRKLSLAQAKRFALHSKTTNTITALSILLTLEHLRAHNYKAQKAPRAHARTR